MENPTLIWFLIGTAFVLTEFALPGLVLLFFGIGAWITSLASGLELANSTSSQLLIFSVASVLSLIALRKYLKEWFVGDSTGDEDELHAEFVGQVVIVTAEIPGGSGMGKVELKGADWNACSETPHQVGDMVKVTERDGLKLTVVKQS